MITFLKALLSKVKLLYKGLTISSKKGCRQLTMTLVITFNTTLQMLIDFNSFSLVGGLTFGIRTVSIFAIVKSKVPLTKAPWTTNRISSPNVS